MSKPPGKSAGPSGRSLTVRVKGSAQRTVSSRRWLARQLNDPYVAEARKQGWRSRAAFKLLELDDKFRLLRPGAAIVDLGAAPGGWTQVAVQAVGARGQVVALDILPMDPVPGATVLQGDFQEAEAEARVIAAMGGRADLVLSDMAPNTTGHTSTDHLRIMGLAELALDFARKVLAPGGAFAAKVLQGGTEAEMLAVLKRDFTSVKHVKPPASRKDSAEMYVVALGFRG